MTPPLEFAPKITRVPLNPEQAVLICSCAMNGVKANFLIPEPAPHFDICHPATKGVIPDVPCDSSSGAMFL